MLPRPPSVDDRWIEKKYAMFFDSFKETTKHQFFFTYWMTLYDVVYILLILSFQNLPVLQCFSIVILEVICLLVSAAIKPFKEKSVAFLFFFNFACVLILAIINLTLAIQAAVTDITSANDKVGWAIFSIILINTSTNIVVGFGGVIYQLISLCRRRIKRNKMSAAPTVSTAPQVKRTKTVLFLNQNLERIKKENLRYNNQSNQMPSRNDDSLARNASRRSEAQKNNNQKLPRIRSTKRHMHTILNLEPRQAIFDPQKIESNHRKIRLQ